MSELRRITAYLKPYRLEDVQAAIASLGITGLTVADVRGCGVDPERTAWGGADVIALPIRARISVVVPAEDVEAVIATIVENAQTGEPGDGKIFVEPVVEALRIRTGERGSAGL